MTVKCDCVKLGRLDCLSPWKETPEGTLIATFFCDACGSTVDLIALPGVFPDDADKWKSNPDDEVFLTEI